MTKSQMENSEDSLGPVIKAACRVASVLGATIEEKNVSAHRYFKFSLKPIGRYYLLKDNNQRRYIIREAPNYYLVDVRSAEQEEHYIVSSKELGKKVDEKTIFLYLNKFLEKRGYRIDNWHWHQKGLLDKKRKATLLSDKHKVVFEISEKTKEFLVRVYDKKEPYLCSEKEQYLLHLYRYAHVDESQKKVVIDSLLKNYEESEIATSRPGLRAKLRNYFYGFYLPDLRKFYSEEGLIPEIKHLIKHVAWVYLALGLLTATILKRVTVRLSGNSWYIVFASLLAPIRIFSEIHYTRRSAVISEYMPSSLQSKISEKEEYRIINERKEAKSWHQFELAYINLIKKNYSDWGRYLEHYRRVKPHLYEVVARKEGKRKEEFAKSLNLPPLQFQTLAGHIENLEPIKEEEMVAIIVRMIEEMKKGGSIKESALGFLLSYAQNTHPRMLREKTYVEASKLLENRIKEAARHPSRMELKRMLSDCKISLSRNMWIDFGSFLSLYGAGYCATYSALPLIVYPVYYLAKGGVDFSNSSGFNRFGVKVNMQYLYEELKKDPTINEEKTWNEFNSHLIRISDVFISLGLGIGILANFLDAFVAFGLALFGTEAFALFCRAKGQQWWYRKMNGYISRCEEEKETEAETRI